jgi:ABC-2 type transport system ATP-binding protein
VPALVARNLWRFYDGEPAVRGLDLEVEPGSAYGFIGPNGAGKSTTLRMLATADQPDAGRLWIDGRDAWHDVTRARRRVGFMPDPFELPDDLTVVQILFLFARLAGPDPDARRRRVEEVLALTGLGARRREKAATLSKGWRQRVLLARTLVHDPAVLLLDEPCSGLDPAARVEFRDIVRSLRAAGKAIVVSSHILAELADFCDAVGIVERGRMLVSGRIEDILRRLEPDERLIVEVTGDVTLATATLSCAEGVLAVRELPPGEAEVARPPRLEARVRGRSTPAQRAELLARLVHAGVKPSGLEVLTDDLEGLFLKVARTGAVHPPGGMA